MGELLFKKEVDKSLLTSGLTLPVDVHEKIQKALGIYLKSKGDSDEISIIMNGNTYQAKFTNVNLKDHPERVVLQIRYSTSNPLCQKLISLYQAFVDAGVEKHYVDVYSSGDGILEFKTDIHDTTKKTSSVWLLSWNPKKWTWSDYEKAISTTQNETAYTIDWNCTNSQAAVGDRVYLTTVGCDQKNGIFASGTIVKGPHSAEHWDTEKRENGFTTKYVEVAYDTIFDYQQTILNSSVLRTLFPNQVWLPQNSGIRIADEYVASLDAEWKKLKEGNGHLTTKEAIQQVKTYIAAKGFSYEDGMIENFYLSLKSKPFVILAGTSGTGKTRLVKLFAEAVGATAENGRYKMVPVRPDWSDSSDLFGHVDLNGRFIPGAVIDFFKRAELDSSHPYFLCLDEMNLARVEYYLSDILSVIETREWNDGHIVSDPIVTLEKYGADTNAAAKYGEVKFPENLYLIGTVNMDETTFPFSRKVLDRANTIEFSYVDLMPPSQYPEAVPSVKVTNRFLRSEYLYLAQCADDKNDAEQYCLILQKINQKLQEAGAHVGYRVRDEIVFYLLNNKKEQLLNDDTAMDNEIMQKILPRIQGSSTSIKKTLCELFKICAGDFEGYQTDDTDVSGKMISKLSAAECKYRKSAEKIAFMVRRYEEDGFTSYWL